MIDEEEYALIKNLKVLRSFKTSTQMALQETKQQYRDAFEQHGRLKMDAGRPRTSVVVLHPSVGLPLSLLDPFRYLEPI